jgi:signal recognition particle receptor subunit beta
VADLDEDKNKLTIKVVYYGPALSGKTTNLVRLHDMIRPERKGEMMVLDTKSDRTLFFDLLPIGMTSETGFFIKLKLFTVPGQVAHDSTRKAVLSRADGIIFVADSQKSQAINNAESFENLMDNAMRVGLDIDRVPMVMQFNKRDLSDVIPERVIMEKWRGMRFPVLFGSALRGTGVKETFSRLLDDIYPLLNDAYGLDAEHKIDKRLFISAMMGDPVIR